MNTRKTATHIPGIRILGNKILLLGAAVLIMIAVMQQPSMLLLPLTPKGMAATALRLFLGLLTAVGVRAYVPSMAGRRRALFPGGWRTLVAFALTLGLLALLYNMWGTQPFRTLRMADLVMHKAYLTQLVAFTLLWLALLK